MNAIQMDISGQFGFFHWNKTKGDLRVTNLFISRTEVLGILGAVLGLDGYAQERFKQKHGKDSVLFSHQLQGLHVSIVPREENKPQFFDDQLIHRSMEHINKKGALMVKMKGLVSLHYTLFISKGQVDDQIFATLCDYLKKGWAEYIPYFGRNQFPLSFDFVKEVHLREAASNDLVIHSLFKEHDVEDCQIDDIDLTDGAYHYVDSLRNFSLSEQTLFTQETTLWSSFEMKPLTPVYVTEENQHIVFL
ncbi:CRISPR-associated protein Cas5 [Metabacillus hrfriensis]|uniref:CRISPR-associated protein Cas5 n=1 Tax=Metabacillus hrfriensis TaxID=3048891 RepID=A0ACD4RHU1_9BACI|nr:CRISPR-associated protein Cas5 [Metabacillus sp. CT-WN-B3]WHZ60080.1 CRISPR-associated protein Cas5 [Metabacillus sp. CT-WN-B3]